MWTTKSGWPRPKASWHFFNQSKAEYSGKEHYFGTTKVVKRSADDLEIEFQRDGEQGATYPPELLKIHFVDSVTIVVSRPEGSAKQFREGHM